jgi:hypothetical protein
MDNFGDAANQENQKMYGQCWKKFEHKKKMMG